MSSAYFAHAHRLPMYLATFDRIVNALPLACLQVYGSRLRALARSRDVHTSLSPVLESPAELAAGSLLYLDMVDEARILVDDGAMLRRTLDNLGQRLAAMGSRRVRKGGGCYWELMPGFRWGDRIEL